jgi:hypothetical protein
MSGVWCGVSSVFVDDWDEGPLALISYLSKNVSG